VADTPEGLYCLAHYIALPSCVQCGAATDQYASDPICAGCQDSDIEVTLVRSSLSLHDETPGHDTISQGQGDLNRGFSKKLRDAGYKDTSDWAQLRRRKRSA
jgi:hypothetical protein